MKSRVFQALLFVCGCAAAAQPMTASADGVLCLDMPGCNDVMLVYNGTAGAGFFSLTGYEYGCGYPERGLDGSARVDGNTIYIAWTEVISSTSATSPRIQQYNVQYSTATKSGPAQYAVHYDGYHQGSGTALGVTCPVSEEYVPSIEVDTVQ